MYSHIINLHVHISNVRRSRISFFFLSSNETSTLPIFLSRSFQQIPRMTYDIIVSSENSTYATFGTSDSGHSRRCQQRAARRSSQSAVSRARSRRAKQAGHSERVRLRSGMRARRLSSTDCHRSKLLAAPLRSAPAVQIRRAFRERATGRCAIFYQRNTTMTTTNVVIGSGDIVIIPLSLT